MQMREAKITIEEVKFLCVHVAVFLPGCLWLGLEPSLATGLAI